MSSQLLNHIVESLRANNAVQAAWLAGSRGRGTNDDFSDIDIWITIDDTNITNVAANPLAFVHDIVPTIMHVIAPQNAPAGGNFILTWIPDEDVFQQVDWYFSQVSTASRAADTIMVIDDVPIESSSPSDQLSAEDLLEKVKDNLLISLQEINNLVKYAKRGTTWRCANSARNANDYLINANWLLANSVLPRFEDRAPSFLTESVPGDVRDVQRLATMLLDTVSDVAARAGYDDMFAQPVSAMRMIVEHWQESGWIPPNEYYRTLPRRRLGSGVLITDPDGRVLLLETTYKDNWEIPGGVCEAGESPREAATREVKEEIGIDIEIGAMLVFDHGAEPAPKGDAIMIVYDGGIISDTSELDLDGVEISRYHFVSIDDVDQHVKSTMALRLRAALQARAENRLIEIDNDGVLT